MTEHKKRPEPASPLPWSIEEITDLGDVISRGFRDANGKGVNRGEEFELFEQPTADYIVWAANNAPKLAERIEQLEAANEHMRNKLSLIVQINPATDSDPRDALDQAVELARKALQ